MKHSLNSIPLNLIVHTSLNIMPKICQNISKAPKSRNDSTRVISFTRFMVLMHLYNIDYKDETEDATQIPLKEHVLETVRRKLCLFLSVLMDEKKKLKSKTNIKLAGVEDSNKGMVTEFGKDNKLAKLCQIQKEMMANVKSQATNENVKITLNISELKKMKMKTNELKAAIYAKGGKPGKFKNKRDLVQKLLKLS